MKILYISPYVPYDGMDHAGGYFLYEYLKKLSEYIEIVVLAPRTIENEVALGKTEDYFKVILTTSKVKRSSALTKAALLLDMLFHPICSSSYLSVIKDELVSRNELFDVDLIELQWTQMAPLVDSIKKIQPNMPVICFSHDVFTQSVIRRAQQGTFSKDKISNIIKSVFVQKQEVNYLNKCDQVFLFSEKDKIILRDMGVNVTITPVVPIVDLSNDIVDDNIRTGNMCLFVGMMKRRENYESMEWFIREIWSIVIKKVPSASLSIVGSSPPDNLMKYNGMDNIEITGYVDNLGSYYNQADLFVAPLLTGAGVKFKVVQALACGLPVVTTTVGAEGIADVAPKGVLSYITDDKEKFANNIVDLLSNPIERAAIGELSKDWAIQFYNFNKNTIARVLESYKDLKKI